MFSQVKALYRHLIVNTYNRDELREAIKQGKDYFSSKEIEQLAFVKQKEFDFVGGKRNRIKIFYETHADYLKILGVKL